MYTEGTGRIIASQFMDGLSFSDYAEKKAATRTMDEQNNNVPQNDEEVVEAPAMETEGAEEAPAAEPAGDEEEAA